MNILAFAASNSSQSINRQLVNHAAAVYKEEINPAANIELLDINDYEMPLYSSDREQAAGIPEQAQQFLAKIAAADALLISYAEHNGFYTAAYKNLFDWASRIDSKVYQGKPMVIFATSPGARGGSNVLEAAQKSAPFFGAELRAAMSVPRFYDNFNPEAGELSDENLQTQLRTALNALTA